MILVKNADFFKKNRKKFGRITKKLYLCTRFRKNGPLAQLNRVPHYGCGGCRFESCMDHKYEHTQEASVNYSQVLFFSLELFKVETN